MTTTIPHEELLYRLALSFMPGISHRRGRALLERFGNATAVFKAPVKELTTIENITISIAKSIREPEVLQRAEQELAFVAKNNIQVLSIIDESYPTRLKNCTDAPSLLYYKGNINLNASKTIAIVGTRKNTDYGNKLTENLIEDLQQFPDIIVISGLALGIDATAHKKSVALGIPTLGILGHGLDTIYPFTHKNLAAQMQENGGILTEFPSGTELDRNNFPARNRIVAGMSDVTVVVESSKTGGALITASMAAGYNREVAAFPGRVGDSRSAGCNELIRTNMAAMITKADDLIQLMNWDTEKKRKPKQQQLFITLTPEEQQVVDVLQTKEKLHSDELLYHSGLANSILAATLLQLEMQGIIKSLPGKFYRMY